MTGEHRANALLQKSFTVDFLTKKKKANEGEIPQYYVKDNHEAIIDPETFEMVQTLMATRKKGRAATAATGTVRKSGTATTPTGRSSGSAITSSTVRRHQIETYLKELQSREPLTEFRKTDWLAMVDYITVHSKDDIRVTFKDGTEIKA